MKITKQDDLAERIETTFGRNPIQINGLCFRRFCLFSEEEKATFLEQIYEDSLTRSFSFEKWDKTTSLAVKFFIKAPPEKQKTHFLIFDENNDLLGRCIIRVAEEEIYFGYALCVSKQHQGFGTRILRSLLEICFERLQLKQDIYGTTMACNKASQAAMEKVGMISDAYVEKTVEALQNNELDTIELIYKINDKIWFKSSDNNVQRPRQQNPYSRPLCDYTQGGKIKPPVDSYERARWHLFLNQQKNHEKNIYSPCFHWFWERVKSKHKLKISTKNVSIDGDSSVAEINNAPGFSNR